MRKRLAFLWMFILLVAALMGVGYGCNADRRGTIFNDEGGGPGTGGNTTTGTMSGVGGGCIFNCGSGGSGSGGGVQGVIQIQPTSVQLDIVDGAIKTQPFTATYNGADVTTTVL